jgi:hypothetical protein
MQKDAKLSTLHRSAFEADLPYLDAENAELSGSSSICI